MTLSSFLTSISLIYIKFSKFWYITCLFTKMFHFRPLSHGLCRAEHVLKYIESLPTIPIHFAPEKRRICTLDDYSAHLVPEVEEAFFKKGYFLIII